MSSKKEQQLQQSSKVSCNSIDSTPTKTIGSSTIKQELEIDSLLDKRQEAKPKRRSARVLEHDPIVAPGFGTAKDVTRLADQLGLQVHVVQDMMRAKGDRGSGSRSSTRGGPKQADEDSNAAAAESSAWADFLGEEGVTNNASAAASASASKSKRAYQLQSIATPSGKAKKTKLAAGVLIQAGTLDSSIVGRTKNKLLEVYHCAIPSQIMPQTKIAAVFTGCNSCHSIALAQNGSIYGWGRNETHQLGSNLPTNVVLPTLLDLPGSGNASSTLQQAATGKGHSLFLMQDGTVYAMGANKVGQCGVKTTSDTVPRPRKCVIVDENNSALDAVTPRMISCGDDFSVLLDTDGYVYSTGSSEFGQLGNGETGEYFVQANKLAFANATVFTRRSDHWYYQPQPNASASSQPNVVLELLPDAASVRIQSIACGKHHTIALEAESTDDKPRLFTWGCGNYGCLGHGRQVDEYYPRQMQQLPMTCDTSNAKVAAGASCNLIQTANGHVYYNGKHRSVGEATMRPILIEQLATNQHVIAHCASGFQSVVCATDIGNTVAWGQGPYGELGLKDQKSSSKPAFVEALSGIPMMQVACGYGHSLFVAREDDKAAKEAIKQLPVVKPEGVESLLK
ncbi:hypothetical protein MPSEU_000912700 [Mayamaea pseudoterrestris]|nr:hypothetical protein MPSEU_000912700 [Mayamaea pseudoterrestris]